MKIKNHLRSGGVAMSMAIGSPAVPSAAVPKPAHGGSNRTCSRQSQKPSIKWQIVTFATLTLSIIASRFIDYYRAAVSWSVIKDWQYLLFAVIVSLLAFPIVYRKIQRNRNDPIFVQLGLIFTAGLGWEKVLSNAADLVKPIVTSNH